MSWIRNFNYLRIYFLMLWTKTFNYLHIIFNVTFSWNPSEYIQKNFFKWASDELQTKSYSPETDSSRRETVFPLRWPFRMLIHLRQFIRTKYALLVSFYLSLKISLCCLRETGFSLIYLRHNQAICTLSLLPKHVRNADSYTYFVCFIPNLLNLIYYTVM